MSDRHPYWSYGPDHGVSPVDALAEGRRAFALETAFALIGTQDHSQVIEAARAFEAYLKGDEARRVPAAHALVETARLRHLERRDRHLGVLEDAGVDNWEGYRSAPRDDDGQ